MLEKKNNRGESAWIAEEIFQDPALDLYNKCQVIDQQIADGVLELNDALEIYEVSMEDYLSYYTLQQSAHFDSRFHSLPKKTFFLYKVKYFHSYFNLSFNAIKSRYIHLIQNNMSNLENAVESEQVKVGQE